MAGTLAVLFLGSGASALYSSEAQTMRVVSSFSLMREKQSCGRRRGAASFRGIARVGEH